MINIMVLGGGGVRGYSQVQVLKKLEHQNGSKLHNKYDLICGTSVGSINAAMIASGKITMDRLENIYPNIVKRIFKRRWFKIPIYDRRNFIDSFIAEVGMIKMKDCLTKLQITSVNLCDKRNHFFKSWEEEDGKKFLVTEVCKSFAAPYFFGTFVDNIDKAVYFDGGMGVGNLPLFYALIEAQMLWPDEEWHFDIVGSGFSNESITFEKAKKYNMFRQLGEYFDIKDAGLARQQSREEQVGAIQKLSLTNNSKISFRYFDTAIPKEYDKLDGVKYLKQYKEIGQKMAEKPLLQS